MEPLSIGHFGTSHFVFCREAVFFLEAEMYCKYAFGDMGTVFCIEVVPFSEGTLLEVPLYSILNMQKDKHSSVTSRMVK